MDPLSIPIRQLYCQIREDVISLQVRWSVFRHLYDSGRETLDLLKQVSPGFFNRMLYNDLLDAMVLGFTRLVDPPATSRNMNASMEQLIINLGDLHPDLVKKLRSHLENVKIESEDLKNWRDKWAAHRDLRTTHTMRARPLQITTRRPLRLNPQKVERALKELGLFLNEFESCFQDGELEISPSLSPEEKYKQALFFDNYKIYTPEPYDEWKSLDDSKKLLELLRKATTV